MEQIPKHWMSSPLSYYANISTGSTPDRLQPLFWEGDIPWIKTGEVKYEDIFETEEHITPEAVVNSSVSISPPGTLLMAMYGQGVTRGRVALLGVAATYNQACAAITPNEKIINRFLRYYYMAAYRALRDSGNETSQMNLNANIVSKFIITVPPRQEQTKIISILDHETAKIDALIEKQQRLIKLLKEKRQAVISHAVTKGLDAEVPMKDSGVEWLGEVPEHWIVRRLKHTSELQSGIPKGKDLTSKASTSIPMLRVANVQDGYLDLEDVHNISIEPDQLERYSLEKGDVLMNEGGDNDKLGRGAVWESQISPCIHQNHVFAIRPHSIEPEWLDLLTRASYTKFHFFREAKQSTNLASISSSNIKETPLVIPPEDERKEIMRYIAQKSEAFKQLEEEGSLQIDLLQERRTALISAAVTGKIDVRNWKASKQNKTKRERTS